MARRRLKRGKATPDRSEVPPRAVCGCGRRHEVLSIDGVRVVGCPVCLGQGEGAEAIRALIQAVREMPDGVE